MIGKVGLDFWVTTYLDHHTERRRVKGAGNEQVVHAPPEPISSYDAAMDISQTQQKRRAKIERLREFFGAEDRPEIYEWSIEDERFEFQLMTNQEIEEYLRNAQ
jgi:hypothetical protein